MIRKFQKECESSCEYILPDYLGDVKKLISTSARAVPSGQFGNDAETECSGIVAFEIIYLDAENKLSSASFSSDYDFSFPIDSERHIDAYVVTHVPSFTVRLTGPRRMIAKANVLSDVCVMERWEPLVSGTAFSSEEEVEKITKSVNIESALKGESVEREYAEEAATMEGIAADEIEVITSNAYVRISESVPVEGGVNIKGELIVTAIIRTPETEVFAIRREIPFDETVSINGATADMSPLTDVTVSSVSCGVSESENSAQITANVITEFSAIVFYNESAELTLDAYLKTKDTTAEYENIDYTSHVFSETKSKSVNVKIPKNSLEMDNLKEILTITADFKGLEFDSSEKTPVFAGDVSFNGVACEVLEDVKTCISNFKFTAPISIDVNTSGQMPENSKMFAKISPAGCEWELDNESLCLKLWYTISYSILKLESERCISSCDTFGEEEYKKCSSCVTVYYPDKDETLFDVAKKFHTTVKDIAKDNMILEPTALVTPVSSGFKKLIIR